jgi:hypothetical protein
MARKAANLLAKRMRQKMDEKEGKDILTMGYRYAI